MTSGARTELLRALGFFLAVLALGAAGAVLMPRLFKAAGTAESDVLFALKEQERAGARAAVSGLPTPPVTRAFKVDRATVDVAPDRRHATAVFTLDFDGTLDGAKVSALGVERVELLLDRGLWVPRGGDWAPGLTRSLIALEARKEALGHGDAAALSGLVVPGRALKALADAGLTRFLSMADRRYEVRAWYLRTERDGVRVSEEFHLAGTTPGRPVDEVGVRSLLLVPQGDRLVFTDLM